MKNSKNIDNHNECQAVPLLPCDSENGFAVWICANEQFLPFINILLFLAYLVCSKDASLSSDEQSAKLLLTMREKTYSNTARLYCGVYRRVLLKDYSRSRFHEFDEKDAADFITAELLPHVADSAVRRFHAVIDTFREEGLVPEDLFSRCKEILEYFGEGSRSCRTSILTGTETEEVILPTARDLEFLANWFKESLGVAAAMHAACFEMLMYIGRELPGLLRRFHKEQMGVSVPSGVINGALGEIAKTVLPGGLDFALVSNAEQVIFDPAGRGTYGDVSMLDVFRIYFGGREKTVRGVLALATALHGRRVRLEGGKTVKDTGAPVLDMLTSSIFAQDFVRELILKRDLTGRQMLDYIDSQLLFLMGVSLPASVYDQVCAGLEEDNALDIPVREHMVLYRTDDYVSGLEHFVKSMAVKKRGKLVEHVKKSESHNSGEDTENQDNGTNQSR